MHEYLVLLLTYVVCVIYPVSQKFIAEKCSVFGEVVGKSRISLFFDSGFIFSATTT